MNPKTQARIYVLNGPNLNLLGIREPEIYGTTTLSKIIETLSLKAQEHGIELVHLQSNHEGVLIDFLNQAYLEYTQNKNLKTGFIVNFGAYSHTSIALFDAMNVFAKENIPIFEVHLSNILMREDFRRNSFVSKIASEVILGSGAPGYEKALHKIFNIFNSHSTSCICKHTTISDS